MDGPAGSVILDHRTKQTLRIDARQLSMWRALSQHGNMRAAAAALASDQTAGSEPPPDAELCDFITQLRAAGLIRVPATDYIGRAYRSAVQHGPRHAAVTAIKMLRRQIDRSLDSRFDRRFGTDTGGIVPVRALGVTGPSVEDAHPFVPTPARLFRQTLEYAVPDASGFVFVDYGSGKGRTLLLASDQPFRQIVGVEFSPLLHEIAEQNIRVYRSRRQRCFDVSSVCADAVDFELPSGDLVLYLWTPFENRVLDSVIDRIAAALARESRRLIIILYTETREFIDRFMALPVALTCHEPRITRLSDLHLHARMVVLTSDKAT